MNLARRILMARRGMCYMPDCDPYWDDVVLLLKGDGPDGSTNIIDSSVYGHPVTVHGNAQISTAQSVYPGGSSMYFDGSGDYLRIDSSRFEFGADDFTIEFWAMNGGSDYGGVIGTSVGYSNYIELSSRRGLFIKFTSADVSYSFNPNDNVWRYYTITRKNNLVRLFVLGELKRSVNVAQNFTLSGGCFIGKYASYHFNGHIQDLRITQNRALYTTNFTPPTAPLPDPDPYDYSLS